MTSYDNFGASHFKQVQENNFLIWIRILWTLLHFHWFCSYAHIHTFRWYAISASYLPLSLVLGQATTFQCEESSSKTTETLFPIYWIIYYSVEVSCAIFLRTNYAIYTISQKVSWIGRPFDFYTNLKLDFSSFDLRVWIVHERMKNCINENCKMCLCRKPQCIYLARKMFDHQPYWENKLDRATSP